MSMLKDWKMNKKFLICIDSDGCAMDTMNIKHIQCFGPCLVKEWNLERWKERILERWNEINLYSMTRGINRFKGLALMLREIDEKLTAVSGVDELINWVERSPELSNQSLREEIKRTNYQILNKALYWSDAVNHLIDSLPDNEKMPFKGVAECLEKAYEFADIAIVSSANEEAVTEEWKRCGLYRYTDLLLCQNAGNKTYCISELKKKGYEKERILMIGDAPGDQVAAEKNGVLFYPVLVRQEAESWKELLHTGISIFKNGTYQSYGEEKKKAFIKNLKG